MQTYQVLKHFSWGQLRFEPQQHILLNESEQADCFLITKDHTKETMFVSKKAFQNYLKLGVMKIF